VDAYAVVSVDRGEQLGRGRRSIPRQLRGARRVAASRGLAIEFVGIDIVVDGEQRREIDALVAEAERLAQAALAELSRGAEFYVVAITRETPKDDPRAAPDSARSALALRAGARAGTSSPDTPAPARCR
jgi:hypothetical protein